VSDGIPPSTPVRRRALNEAWAAAIVGIVLLGLVLSGAIPGWLVP
jgi:hypothetical protein